MLLLGGIALNQPRDDRRPARLVVRPEAQTTLAVEVFMKQNEVLIGLTLLETLLLSVARPGSVGTRQEQADRFRERRLPVPASLLDLHGALPDPRGHGDRKGRRHLEDLLQ